MFTDGRTYVRTDRQTTDRHQAQKEIPNLQQWDFFQGTQEEFETAVVNELTVFEPLKFYCNTLPGITERMTPHVTSEEATTFLYV